VSRTLSPSLPGIIPGPGLVGTLRLRLALARAASGRLVRDQLSKCRRRPGASCKNLTSMSKGRAAARRLRVSNLNHDRRGRDPGRGVRPARAWHPSRIAARSESDSDSDSTSTYFKHWHLQVPSLSARVSVELCANLGISGLCLVCYRSIMMIMYRHGQPAGRPPAPSPASRRPGRTVRTQTRSEYAPGCLKLSRLDHQITRKLLPCQQSR
jgi:hypothetical protein